MKEGGRFPRTKNAALAGITVLAASPLLIRYDSVTEIDEKSEILQKVVSGDCSKTPINEETVVRVSYFENDGQDFDLRLRDGTDDKSGETADSRGDIIRVNTETHTLQRDPAGHWGNNGKVTSIRTQEGNGEFQVTALNDSVLVNFSCNK